MSLGRTIAKLRKQKGWTQAQLAGRIEVHPSLIARWERDQIQPRTKALERAAEALETTAAQLQAGDVAGVATTLHEVDDPQLMELFSQVHKLNVREREALKTFLEAVLTRVQLEEMVTRRGA